VNFRIEDENNTEDVDILQEQLDIVIRQATVAYIKREERIAREEMREKGIAVFSASATTYLAWRNRMRRKDPLMDPQTSGIPALRRFFFGLPAKTNFKNYYDHVYKDLPAFRRRAGRALEKHTEDEYYAKMRKDLELEIPILKNYLGEVVELQLQQTIAQPWSSSEEKQIVGGIKRLVAEDWKHPHIFYNGFRRMIRDNGIPVDGTYSGRNLNEELLGTMSKHIDSWHTTMTDRAEPLAQAVNKPVQDLLNMVEQCINTCSAGPSLKKAASDALIDVWAEIEEAYDSMLSELQENLQENHLRFTTEIDITCPIAEAMKPRYKRAQDEKFILTGKGIYNRVRNVLRDAMLKPARHNAKLPELERIKPLIHSLKEQLMSRQNDVWKAACGTFISDTIEHLQGFSRSAEGFLENEAFITEAHKKAREQLKDLLVNFDTSLKEVQAQFKDVGDQPPEKKVKIESEEGPASKVSPASCEQGDVMLDGESVPIVQNLGWHHFAATLFPLRSD
jgi:hypothetical protein